MGGPEPCATTTPAASPAAGARAQSHRAGTRRGPAPTPRPDARTAPDGPAAAMARRSTAVSPSAAAAAPAWRRTPRRGSRSSHRSRPRCAAGERWCSRQDRVSVPPARPAAPAGERAGWRSRLARCSRAQDRCRAIAHARCSTGSDARTNVPRAPPRAAHRLPATRPTRPTAGSPVPRALPGRSRRRGPDRAAQLHPASATESSIRVCQPSAAAA